VEPVQKKGMSPASWHERARPSDRLKSPAVDAPWMVHPFHLLHLFHLCGRVYDKFGGTPLCIRAR